MFMGAPAKKRDSRPGWEKDVGRLRAGNVQNGCREIAGRRSRGRDARPETATAGWAPDESCRWVESGDCDERRGEAQRISTPSPMRNAHGVTPTAETVRPQGVYRILRISRPGVRTRCT